MIERFRTALAGTAALLALAFASATIAQQAPKSGASKGKAKSSAKAEKKADDAEKDADKPAPKTEKATFGGGCFWCLEAVYERIPGVKNVVSGYAGGRVARPTYALVSTGTTGHAEVVQIEYDPEVISYERLVEIFWHCHDPTSLNRQGPDEGTQYRSIILYHNEEQRKTALESAKKLTDSGELSAPIVTELVPLKAFYAADRHHQDYYRRNKNAPYCLENIAPKLHKLGLDRPQPKK